jgi:hypothetical protein
MLKTVSTANGLVSPTFSGNVTLSDGNLVIGTSGKGIDFSATPGTGTSELLSDYEEGTWVPIDSSGAGLTFASAAGKYTKIGRQVTCFAWLVYPTTLNTAGIVIGGLPFSALSTDDGHGVTSYNSAGFQMFLRANAPNNITGVKNDNSSILNVNLSGAVIGLQYTMFV